MENENQTIIVSLDKEYILSERTELPQNRYGIYFLLKGDDIVYVGKTTVGDARIMTHIAEGKKDFDSYSFIDFVEREDLDLLEALYIYKFRPIYNSTSCIKKSVNKKLLNGISHKL